MAKAEKRTEVPLGVPASDRPSKKPPPKKREKPPNLNVKTIQRLKEPGRYRDGATRGLYLRWDSRTSASWLYRYEIDGRERWMGLGSLADVSLDEARDAAEAARKGLRKKMGRIDPIEASRAERLSEAASEPPATPSLPAAGSSGTTFAEMVDRYHDEMKSGWKNEKYRDQVLSILQRYACPHIGAMDITDIRSQDVRRCVKPIWTEKHETAVRLLEKIGNVIAFARAEGIQFPSNENPAAMDVMLKGLPTVDPVVKHHAALCLEDVPVFMKALAARPGVAAKALEFTILTAARTGETIGATWDEIDWAARLWKIPGHRMKKNKEHQVPLSQRAIAILKSLDKTREKGNPFIFIGDQKGKGLSNAAMMAVIKRMIDADPAMAKILALPNGKHVTVHGFRSAFRDWGGDHTDHDRGALEWSLAHNIYTTVEGSYARRTMLTKRFPLMKDWADYCAGKLELRPIAMGDDEDVAA